MIFGIPIYYYTSTIFDSYGKKSKSKWLIENSWISEWAHHSDHDREPWDWQPEEESRGCQDEAGNRDKGNWFSVNLSKCFYNLWSKVATVQQRKLIISWSRGIFKKLAHAGLPFQHFYKYYVCLHALESDIIP